MHDTDLSKQCNIPIIMGIGVRKSWFSKFIRISRIKSHCVMLYNVLYTRLNLFNITGGSFGTSGEELFHPTDDSAPHEPGSPKAVKRILLGLILHNIIERSVDIVEITDS